MEVLSSTSALLDWTIYLDEKPQTVLTLQGYNIGVVMGALCGIATDFILDKAKFASECGQFGENFNAV
jgi:hypothetical protein